MGDSFTRKVSPGFGGSAMTGLSAGGRIMEEFDVAERGFLETGGTGLCGLG